MGNDEIDRNVGFALEPINKFALPHPTVNRNIEHDQLYWVKIYVIPILIELLESKTGWNLMPFLERYIYSYTTKEHESLETHGEILRLCSPFSIEPEECAYTPFESAYTARISIRLNGKTKTDF